jgi:hypothetical protein
MANSTRFLQTAKNRIPFLKNVSTNVILLASLFILSIILYYTFNKNSLEHMDNENDNGSDNGNSSNKLVEGLPRGPTALSRLERIVNGRRGY